MTTSNARLMHYNGSIYIAYNAVTAEEISLVRQSFQKIGASGQSLSALFYQRLFEVAPQVESLFAYSLKEQENKFTQMLTVLVEKLDCPSLITSVLQDLGQRHLRYDVKDEHYDVAGDILIWALGEHQGDAFDAKTKKAWISVYNTFAVIMKTAHVTPLPDDQYYKSVLQGTLIAHYGADSLPGREITSARKNGKAA